MCLCALNDVVNVVKCPSIVKERDLASLLSLVRKVPIFFYRFVVTTVNGSAKRAKSWREGVYVVL